MELLKFLNVSQLVLYFTKLLQFYEIVLSTCRPWLHIYLHMCHWTVSCGTHTHTHIEVSRPALSLPSLPSPAAEHLMNDN